MNNVTPPALSVERIRYLQKQKRRRRLILVCQIGILAALLILWEVAARLGWIDPFIPHPRHLYEHGAERPGYPYRRNGV